MINVKKLINYETRKLSMTDRKTREDSISLGLLTIVVVQMIAGLAQISGGLWQTFHGDVLGYLFFGVGVADFVAGVGLAYVKRLAWYLSIGLNIAWILGRFAMGFIIMISTQTITTISIPLEPIVIAYLIWKRKLFFAEVTSIPLSQFSGRK